MRGVSFDPDEIRQYFAAIRGLSSNAAKVRATCQHFACSPGTVDRAIKARGTSKSPMGPAKLGAHRASILAIDHPATVEKRTVFPTMVFDVGDERVLKSGENSGKIGGRILKGAWRGFPVFTLSLEERASCPTSCQMWGSCYGNNMPFARRWRHGPELEWRIEREVAALELIYRGGFAVRLHSLGDFYSLAYVKLWLDLMARHKALHVFGYTAHVDTERDDIAYALAMAVRELWPRFAVRFSNGDVKRCTTVSIEHPISKPPDAIICPAQTGKTESCATCALCWSTTRRIAFLRH